MINFSFWKKPEFLGPFVMTFMVVFFVTGFVTWLNIGFNQDFLIRWLIGWLLGWPIAAFAVISLRRIGERLTYKIISIFEGE